jgi:hypothetical protein
LARTDGFTLLRAAYRQRQEYPGEEVDLPLPRDLDRLIRLRGELEGITPALSEVRRQLDLHIIEKLGAQGMTRRGPKGQSWFYRVSPSRRIKIKPEAQSRFFDWVRAHDLAERLFNPNQARATGLQAMKNLPDPETGELIPPGEWEEIFLDIEERDGHTLDVIPESRMSKWQLRFPEGYVQQGGPIEKETHGNDGKNESGGGADSPPRG